jgi:hypothetical protein
MLRTVDDTQTFRRRSSDISFQASRASVISSTQRRREAAPLKSCLKQAPQDFSQARQQPPSARVESSQSRPQPPPLRSRSSSTRVEFSHTRQQSPDETSHESSPTRNIADDSKFSSGGSDAWLEPKRGGGLVKVNTKNLSRSSPVFRALFAADDSDTGDAPATRKRKSPEREQHDGLDIYPVEDSARILNLVLLVAHACELPDLSGRDELFTLIARVRYYKLEGLNALARVQYTRAVRKAPYECFAYAWRIGWEYGQWLAAVEYRKMLGRALLELGLYKHEDVKAPWRLEKLREPILDAYLDECAKKSTALLGGEEELTIHWLTLDFIKKELPSVVCRHVLHPTNPPERIEVADGARVAVPSWFVDYLFKLRTALEYRPSPDVALSQLIHSRFVRKGENHCGHCHSRVASDLMKFNGLLAKQVDKAIEPVSCFSLVSVRRLVDSIFSGPTQALDGQQVSWC